MFDYKELNRIKMNYYDPANSTDRLAYEMKTGQSTSGKPKVGGKTRTRFHVGFVEDNKDPDKLGRIKVRFPQWGEGFISQWIALIRPFCGPEMGFWALPGIDEKVLCVFIGDNTVRPMAMGNIYSGETGIPVDDVSDNNIRIMTSPSGSKIIFDDTEGEEKIIVSMKEGKMRMVLDKAKGIQIVNECGDINLKCRKLTITAGDTASIVTKKALKITAQKEIKIKSSKGANFKASGDLIVKGQKIELKGSSGVTAQMKQIAAKDDQVVGVDTHIEMVPAGPSMVPTPIPNPYMGKLADKLSTDVEVKGKACAVKGSKSKATPGHIPMPPGVQFQKAPSNEGEVTMGTVPTVLVNGKEVAVLGAMVKTCGDPMDMETCSIIAAGASVFVPIVIPGLEYAYDAKKGGTQMNTRDPVAKPKEPGEPKVPKLENPQWEKSKASVGEEMKLEVTCTDQYPNAGVTFKVWPEGADTANDFPLKTLHGPNKGGKAEARWRYSIDAFEVPPVTSDLVAFYKERLGADIDMDLLELLVKNYEDSFDNPTDKTAKFIFTADSFRCEQVESEPAEIGEDIGITFLDSSGSPLKEVEYTIIEADGNKIEGKTSEDGKIEKPARIPGVFQIQFKYEPKKDS